MSYDQYLNLTWYDRFALHQELDEMIESSNAPSPKDLRR